MSGRCGVGALAALLWASAASADEAEIFAHFDAYSAAVSEARFEDAEAEGEAAWRAAEAEWGAREETAVLAFQFQLAR